MSIHDAERESGGDGGIDGVTAGRERIDRSPGGERMNGRGESLNGHGRRLGRGSCHEARDEKRTGIREPGSAIPAAAVGGCGDAS